MATPKMLSLKERYEFPLHGRFVRQDEAALRLGVSYSQVDALVAKGELPPPVRRGSVKTWPGEFFLSCA